MVVIDKKIWGKDIRLFGGDLKPSSMGDLDFLESLDNLLQAIRLRLTTEKGFLLYDPSYGIDLSLFLGRKNLVEKQEMLKFAIIDALGYEARIQSIDKIVVYVDSEFNDRLHASVTLTPITTQEGVTLNLIFPWYETNSTALIEDEVAVSTSKGTVVVDYDIYAVEGVWTSKGPHYSYNVSTNRLISGTNYYTPSGSFYGKTITLDKPLPATFVSTFVTYQYYVSESI